MAERTTVHLVRHGEVFNPEKLLYGRRRANPCRLHFLLMGARLRSWRPVTVARACG